MIKIRDLKYEFEEEQFENGCSSFSFTNQSEYPIVYIPLPNQENPMHFYKPMQKTDF